MGAVTTLLFVLLALVVPFQSPQPQNPPVEQTDETTKQESEANGGVSEAIEPVSGPRASTQETYPRDDSEPPNGTVFEWATSSDGASWIVALAGIGAFIAAVKTLQQIKEQSRIARQAADAAKESAESSKAALIMTNRAYTNPEHWDAAIPSLGERSMVQISFDFVNNGRYPATIQTIEIREPLHQVQSLDVMVFPDKGYPFSFRHHVNSPLDSQGSYGIQFHILGRVRYFDGFVIRDRFFDRRYIRDRGGSEFEIPDGNYNNEREAKEGEEAWKL